MSEPSAWAKAQAAAIITACPAGHDRYPSCAECVRVALDAAWRAGVAAKNRALYEGLGQYDGTDHAGLKEFLEWQRAHDPAPGEER